MQKPVSVVHLMYGLQLGGLEQLVVQLSAAARERGIWPTLLAIGPDGPVRDLAQREGLRLTHIETNGLSVNALMAIRKTLEDADAAVLHAHDLGPWLNAVAARALRPKTKVIATFHEQRAPAGKKRTAAQVAARFSEALVACGDQVRTEIRSWAPGGTSVRVIANGVPFGGGLSRKVAREELGIPHDVTAIGYIGRLRPLKGPDKLVEAFLDQFAGNPRVQLVLIGTGPLEEELRARVAAHANVKLAGVVLNAGRYLQAFDVYAQPSLSEGRSLAMLEAMGAGLPTIAHDLVPVREIHEHEKTALLVPLADRAKLGEALRRLVEDRELRVKLGAAARERSRPHSIEGMADAYASLYRDVAA